MLDGRVDTSAFGDGGPERVQAMIAGMAMRTKFFDEYFSAATANGIRQAVILASGLGLPVSSTHIAVGAVFGVGFFREFYTRRSRKRREMVTRGRYSDEDDDGALPVEVLQHRKLVRR